MNVESQCTAYVSRVFHAPTPASEDLRQGVAVDVGVRDASGAASRFSGGPIPASALLGAAQALKTDPQDVKAVGDMRTALAHYPQYFDDPGWDQTAAAEHVRHDKP